MSPSSSPRRDLSNELGPSSGNKKVSTFFGASEQSRAEDQLLPSLLLASLLSSTFSESTFSESTQNCILILAARDLIYFTLAESTVHI